MVLDVLLTLQKIEEISKDLIFTPPSKFKELMNQSGSWKMWAESKYRNRIVLKVTANTRTGIWFFGLAVKRVNWIETPELSSETWLPGFQERQRWIAFGGNSPQFWSTGFLYIKIKQIGVLIQKSSYIWGHEPPSSGRHRKE